MHGLHHAFQHRIEELTGFLGVTVGQQFHGAFEVGKQDGDLLPFAFQCAAGGEDFLCEIGRGIGQWRHGRCRGHTAPDQHRPLLIGGQTLTVDEFDLEIIKRLVIKLELSLQGPIGHPAPLA
jgi:hypothetical protein